MEAPVSWGNRARESKLSSVILNLASLHGKVCMGSFLPARKGSQEATIQLHFFTLPFGDRTWSHGSHVGLCAVQLEEASFTSLPL